MSNGYVRQSAANIVTGHVIQAADLNAEFNALANAFDATVGHVHDGTTGGGGLIPNTVYIGGSVSGTNTIVINSTSPANYSLNNGSLITFTPANSNTSSTVTVNINGTGAKALKKINQAGIINPFVFDVTAGIPILMQYNSSGDYYLYLNILFAPLTTVVATNQALTFANYIYQYVATTALTLTLDVSTNLGPTFNVFAFALGGAITVTPNAADTINGGVAGASVIIPKGNFALINTDGAGKVYVTSTNLSLANTLTTSGNFPITFTATGSTTVTLPTSGTLATTAGTIANATNIGITDDTTTNATMYPLWVTANTGNLPAKVTSTKLSFNPSTGTLSSTVFIGNLTGNVTGNVSGTAPAGTLTGTTLASNVVTSSLTTVGTIATGVWNGTIITSAFGGTGNGFTKFTGPAASEKTFTLPNASDTIGCLGTIQTWTAAQTFNSSKLVLAGSSSGTTVLNSGAAAGSSVLTLPIATDTLVGKATTDTFTNKTYDTAGTGNSFSINSVAVTANTGTGAVARATNAVFVTPTLGTPVSGTLTTCTGYTVANLSDAGWTSFSPTFTGFSANPTVTAKYKTIGKVIHMSIKTTVVGTSNATGFTIGNLPVNTSGTSTIVGYGQDAGVSTMVTADVASNIVTLYKGASLTAASWTASGNKFADLTFIYESA